MFIVLIAETGRIPVDNPATHLELTMIHEAMILEYSGPYLALIEWGASLKQLVLMTLLVNTFFPFGLSPAWNATGLAVGLGFYLLKLLVICCAWWSWSRRPTPRCACSVCRNCWRWLFILGALALISTFLF